MANTILTSYPDGKRGASPEYVAELVKALAACSQQEMDWIMDRREGLVARSPKFLPSIGQIAELVGDRRRRLEAVRPAPTSYRRLSVEEQIEQPPGERRKAQVRELLGYDPAAPQKRTKRDELLPPTAEDFEAVRGAMKLKPPSASDATETLRKWLKENWEAVQERNRT